ncbi:TonB family protein [Salegentibacter sp. LM13S]|uniref:TonB family protein n=1 Tax=Salegentibacter lacus TaxID=2873599 RepID=UPI001CCF57A0|nr:TonB family protein [Salegentibacter lacus]MBZ9630506.1 TonB family protein [Salegentibacter lacus]
MKNFYLSLIFTAISISAFCQDTIYMDKDYQELDTNEDAKYFKITTPASESDAEFLRTTYFIDGTKKAEQSFNLKGKTKVYHGLHKHYYESGELFYQLPYKNGKKHGNLVAYWENGEKRRQDLFKRDKLKEGKVWNEKGEELDYFAYLIPASFPGGKEKLQAFLKKNINMPQEQKRGVSVRVVLRFTINPEGDLSEIQIIEGAPHRYNAEAVRVLTQMPQWSPTQHFGKSVATRYSLPIIFQK